MWWKVIIVSALSLSLRDRVEREIEPSREKDRVEREIELDKIYHQPFAPFITKFVVVFCEPIMTF